MGEKPREIPDEINFGKDTARNVPDEQIASEQEIFGLDKENENKEYHFKEMAEIEPAMASLIGQLKESIENGKYGSLLSDDAGGRIPTLVLDKIFKEKSPKKVNTYFLGGGIRSPRKTERKQYNELINYLKKMDFGDKGLLVVTQIIVQGGTLKKIGEALKDIGINNFDFASMYEYGMTDALKEKDFLKIFGAELFLGERGKTKGSKFMASDHERVSGVRSQIEYSPYPELHLGRDEIKKSREDLELMVERIIEKVWGKEK